MILFAHHFEPAFAPIYFGQFLLGIWAGWQLTAVVLKRLTARAQVDAASRRVP